MLNSEKLEFSLQHLIVDGCMEILNYRDKGLLDLVEQTISS